MTWNGWPLARTITLLVGLAYLMILVQVFLFHYRQNFRHKAMWLPVALAPVIGLGAILLALLNTPALVGVVKALLWFGVLDGLGGFYYHFRGVGQRVEGYVLRNFLVGPPIMLPLMFSALGVVGLFAVYWR